MGIVQGLLMLLLALTQFGTLSEKDLESALSNPETPSKQLRLRGRTSDFHFQCFSLKHYFKRWITPSRMQRLQNHSVALKRTTTTTKKNNDTGIVEGKRIQYGS